MICPYDEEVVSQCERALWGTFYVCLRDFFPIGNNNINWGTAVIIVIIAICATVVLHILDDTEAIFRSDLHMWLIAIWLSTGVIIGKCLP